MSNTQGFIVTSAPPNPNGDLHVGHLAGPFLGADVLTRYLRQTGREVVHVGYSDDYSCYVTRRAAELGTRAEEVAHLFGRQIEQSLALGGMLQDYFTHPLREPVHAEVVRRFFRELWDSGAFEVQDLPTYWCDGCARYLYEAEMRGRCQFCDAPSDGVYCEECGRPQDTTGLRAPQCTRCGEPDPEIRTLRRIVFPLEKYRERLRDHYAKRELRPRLRAYLDDMFSRPLPATPVSRVSSYGIGVPLPGWEGNILDTWFSGIWGYVAGTIAEAAARGLPDAGLAAWGSPDTSIVHFIGFDCGFSHAILWPALLLAHGGFRLPEHVVTNEFYQLEGQKFSTSRGHAIWGGDLLRRVPADLVRFYLCLTGPEREQSSFAAKDFVRTVNEQVVGSLQDWIRAVFDQVREECSGQVPSATPLLDGDFAKLASGLAGRMGEALSPERFSPQRAASEVLSIVQALPGATAELAAARSGPRDRYEALLASHVELLATLAATTWPLMPALGLALWKALRLPIEDPLQPTIRWPGAGVRLVPGGHTIDLDPPALFQPVEL
jgi:methionyl-tRNA synthetase